jgi:two-component system response regulator HydG
MSKRGQILLIDDEEALCTAAEKILIKEGYQVRCCHTAADGLDTFAREGADLLITDFRLPDRDGIEVLKRAKELRPTVEVIMITGHGTVERAVEAMRLDAYDFIVKPLDRNALVKAVQNAVEKRRLAEENRQLREQLQQQRTEDGLVGNNPTMIALKKLIRQIAPTDVSVLIQGESGTGKEIVADVIHSLSPRADKPIIKISCAAIPETLLESELFGYERGAFTGASNAKPGKFELANGGTLFLDEIAEMSPQLQAKLLRVLQDQRLQRLGSTRDIQVDVRVISATHVDIHKAIEEQKFRADLYYRLNVVQIGIPPLRARRDDISLLVDHFLNKYNARMRKSIRAIAPAALEQLQAHPWPGNVRELENTVQRAIAVTPEDVIERFQITPPTASMTSGGAAISVMGNAVTIPVGSTLAEAEDRIIAATLQECSGDKEQAAKMLGISSRTLYRRFSK